MSTMGSDFWLGFMDNNDDRLGDDMLKVMVSGPRACSVTFSNPNTGYSTTATVTPNSVTRIDVPQSQGYYPASCQVQNGGFHLTATDSVSVYVSVVGQYSYDVANVYPTRVLRDEYMIQSYLSDRYGSEFNIIATEDSTWVDIHLTSSTDGGHTAGSTISVFLSRAGKSYLVKSPAVGDFTGTIVKSRECKKIAVFQGDVCVYIPEYTYGQSCDHVEEQAVPVEYWGKNFLVLNSGSTYADVVRVTSLRDSCRVVSNGSAMATLNAGETYEFNMSGLGASSHLSSSEPVSVNVFFSSTFGGYGDPSMVTICPLEQKLKNVTFASFNTRYTTTHYVNIIAKTDEIQWVELDGNSLPNNWSTAFYYPFYSYMRVNVSAGSHTLSMSRGEGFTAYAFGFGSHESYAYSVGANMIDLRQRISINDFSMATIIDTVDVCQNDSVFLRAYADYEYDSVVWNVGNGVEMMGNSVVYQYSQPGVYEISAFFYKQTANSCYSRYDTIRSNVRVNASDTILTDTSVCGESFVWLEQHCDSTGTYYQTFVNSAGCESVRMLDLSLLHNVESVRTISGCDSVYYEGQYYHSNDTITKGIYTATNGCDSIDRVRFVANPSYDITLNVHLKAGDTLEWIDGKLYSGPTEGPEVSFVTVNGCDSIVRLHLVVDAELPTVDSAAIWVPNAFTPDEKTNTEFRVYGNNVTMMRVYIYRRNGTFVTKFDGLAESWDGSCKGMPCPEEAYVYKIEYTTAGRPQYIQEKTGTVLLLR